VAATSPPWSRSTIRPSARARLRAKLSSPEALREAILLHEVLVPPVPLREPAHHVTSMLVAALRDGDAADPTHGDA
jgi:hypothetical protein